MNCIGGFVCPAGSTEPLFNETKQEIISTQPDNFNRQTEKASSIFYIVEISLIVCGIFVIIGIILVSRLRNLILKLDNFQTVHNYQLNTFMIKKKTLLGGIFTFFYLIAALLILANSLILFEVDNQSESKSLVPLVVLEETMSLIQGNFVLTVTLMNYGGECVINVGNQTSCHPRIYHMTSKLNCESTAFLCLYSKNKCNVVLKLKKCSLQSTTKFSFSFQEKSSYASGISVLLQSDSSIPDQKSSIEMTINSQSHQVFRGYFASFFEFSLTSSYFVDKVKEMKRTGFHVSPSSTPIQGSSYSLSELGFSSDLNVNVQFDRSLNALKIERTLNFSTFILILALIGSIPGLKGIFESVLALVEENWIKLKEWIHRQKISNEIHDNREKTETSFENVIDATKRTEGGLSELRTNDLNR